MWWFHTNVNDLKLIVWVFSGASCAYDCVENQKSSENDAWGFSMSSNVPELNLARSTSSNSKHSILLFFSSNKKL
jgi:hypothetical protein